MKITKKWLINHKACQPGIDWFEEQKENDAEKLFKLAIACEKFGYVNWVLTEKFTKKQNLMYVIFSAEQVLPIFENEFSDDKRPREAIDAAKKCLKSPTKKNRDAARAAARAASAAAYADSAAAYAASAAVYAASAAASAASAAARAASAAASAAADAAYAAAYAAACAAACAAKVAAYAAKEKMFIKILNYGFDLLRVRGLK